MQILLTGKDGQLGYELHRRLERHATILAVGRDDLDFCNPEELHLLVRRLPELTLIINAAAYTNVDEAEREPLKAQLVNLEAPAILAAEADRRNISIIHFSTDYVFDGKKWTRPYTEEDRPNPLSVYGWSKLAGEQRVLELCEKALVFRVSSLYGTRHRNFLTTMLKYAYSGKTPHVVDDQLVSPNWTPMIAEAVEHVVRGILLGQKTPWGLYHLSGAGSTTWYEFARRIFQKAEKIWNVPKNEPVPVDAKEFGAAAKRPTYSVLNAEKFNATFGDELPDWQSQFLLCAGMLSASRTSKNEKEQS